ncbi:hypothetical protein FOM00_26395 [Pseudomonas sp. ST1]|nr:hypothetical protein BKM19_022305 [Pseudomonas amygdali pv. morsprunorum]POP94493.1 hypothetical protein CXB39_10750 [Pseudomonas amygdali pv. morsprunorum]TSC32492.1 hypothetical protein FOM00_26395 [Pseudomonas sp. ST1]
MRRRASRPAFPRWSVRNDNLNYRATFMTIVRRSASHAVLDALRPLERRVQGHQGHDRAVF